MILPPRQSFLLFSVSFLMLVSLSYLSSAYATYTNTSSTTAANGPSDSSIFPKMKQVEHDKATIFSRRLDVEDPLEDNALDLKSEDPDMYSRVENYSPVFDFDEDGCLPAAAIGRRNGDVNGGLKTTGHITGKCDAHDFMDRSNTYHRWGLVEAKNGEWNDKYEVHMYSLYFEKDQTDKTGVACHIAGAFGACGHRHDFEDVIVLFKNSNPFKVAVSAHGDYKVKDWSNTPLKDGKHPKVVYHKDEGFDAGGTHALRFAGVNEQSAENPTKRWVTPPLASWFYMGGNNNEVFRFILENHSFGKASMKNKNRSFERSVLKAFRSYLPSDAKVISKNPPGQEDKYTYKISKSYFNEEDGGFSPSSNSPIFAIQCKFRYCDKKKIVYSHKISNALDRSKQIKLGKFSEEGLARRDCPKNMLVSRIRCTGSYCDNLELYCAPMKAGSSYKIYTTSGLHQRAFFSEEQGGSRYLERKHRCPTGYFVRGMQCSGRYCDKISLRCTKVGKKK